MNDMTAALENVAALAKYEAAQEFAEAKARFERDLLEAHGARDDALRRRVVAEAEVADAVAARDALIGGLRALLSAL